MEKILFVATVDEHIRHFHYPFLEWFKNRGYEVHVASKGKEDLEFVDKKYNIPFEKSPFSLSNLRAYNDLKRLIKENDYKLVHCHTPVGGVMARLASIPERKRGLRVVYTAHGFHFYKGAPKKNWILYYPVEKFLSRFTDVLILINEEDYNLALNKRFKAEKIEHVRGVGVNFDKFIPQTPYLKQSIRKKHSYSDDDFILVYVGELRYRKNQELLIKVIEKTKNDIPNIKLLLVGDGDLYSYYYELIKSLDLDKNIELLGYRKDVPELMLLSDIAVSSALQEGLPVNVMEAMATGLALIVSNCRGNRDLVINGENGFVFEIDDIDRIKSALIELYKDKELMLKFGQDSLNKVKQYNIKTVLSKMEEIYLSLL